MNDSDDGAKYLSLDVSVLWDAGGVTLPRAANKFGRAATHLHTTSAYDTMAFAGMQDGFQKLKENWTEFRDLAQDKIIGPTGTRLNKAGNALCEVAVDVAATDKDNGDGLSQAIEYLRDHDIEGRRPPDHVTKPPTSDDPPPQVN